MMQYTCQHNQIARDCDDCFNDARAISEMYGFGTFIPKVTRCKKHPKVPLTENWNCAICAYAGESKKDKN